MPTLTDLLKEKENKPDSQYLAGQRLFFAQKEQIVQAIQDRWTLKEIWQTLHDTGKMPVGYRAFTNYVYRFITNPQKDKENGTTKKERGDPEKTAITALTPPAQTAERIPRGLGGSSRIASTPLKDVEDPRNHPDSPIFNQPCRIKFSDKPDEKVLI